MQKETRMALMSSPLRDTRALAGQLGIPEEQITKHDYEEILFLVNHGAAVETYDIQALPLMEQKEGLCWQPYAQSTLVLAVDRDQTEAKITGWADVANSGERVSVFSHSLQFRMMMAGVCYGLAGNVESMQPALAWFEKLAQQGCLIVNDWDAPILICLDDQAAEWNRHGRNLEIIVPKEGTLCFARGILSSQPVALSAQALQTLTYGLHNMDENQQDYPDRAAYACTKQITQAAEAQTLTRQTESAWASFQRQVLHKRLYSSANAIEHQAFAIVFIVLAVGWLISARQRIVNRYVANCALLVGVLLIGWIFLRFFKYQLPIGTLNRYCWYGYYVFLLLLPLAIFSLTYYVDRQEASARFLKIGKAVLAFYLLLLLLVFTNDLHQWVFRFDLSSSDWGREYTYGFVYYVIWAAEGIPILCSMVLLIYKAKERKNRWALFFTIAIPFLLFLYSFLYALRFVPAWDSDFAMTVAMVTICYIEILLRTGMIPANAKYKMLFAHSSLQMQILDAKGNVAVMSAKGEPLSPWLGKQFSEGKQSVQQGDFLTCQREIQGGTVVWQENVHEIKQLYEQIQQSNQALQEINAMLMAEHEIKQRRVRAEQRSALLAQLDAQIEDKMEELMELVSSAPEQNMTSEDICFAAFLLCSIKRRCNLFFIEQQTEWIEANDLLVAMDELIEFAGYMQIKVLLRSNLKGKITIRQAALWYDFFCSVLTNEKKKKQSTVFCRMEQTEREIALKIMLAPHSPEPVFSKEMQMQMEREHGWVEHRDLEGAKGIWLCFPRGAMSDV